MKNLKELLNALKTGNPDSYLALKVCMFFIVIAATLLVFSQYANAQERQYCEKPDGTIIITKWAVCPAGTTPV
jgi:hypothetical protein